MGRTKRHVARVRVLRGAAALVLLVAMVPGVGADTVKQKWDELMETPERVNEEDAIAYAILDPEEPATLFINAGLALVIGKPLDYSLMGVLGYYALRYQPLPILGLSATHWFSPFPQVLEPLEPAGATTVGPEPRGVSNLKTGGEVRLLTHRVSTDYRLVLDRTELPAGFTRVTYIDIPYHSTGDLTLRAGYVHRLGRISFAPVDVYFGDNDPYPSEYLLLANTYFHGVYAGIGYNYQRDITALYVVGDQPVVRQYRESYFMKHDLDVHWFPYAEMELNGSPMEVSTAVAVEYRLSGTIPAGVSTRTSVALDLVVGAGPFFAPTDPGEYGENTILNTVFNSVYFGLALGIGLNNGPR